ncbi:hypothetical protein ACRQF6_01510 [Actinotignum sp. GS-2025f]|uniref:hypothetical protein n=1 Tax=unclassified Actinotignum TaxID=2632702 RepID=UPI002A7F4305|nr:hypothetical protein [Actinotignum sp. SLA_B059]MDY5127449.1 hypothetical protein [Actinotignum sp. SLA_B059]
MSTPEKPDLPEKFELPEQPEQPETQVEPVPLDAAQAEEIQRIARRRMIAAAIVGVILLIIMFFAGRALRQHLSAPSTGAGESVTVIVTGGAYGLEWQSAHL